MILYHGSTSVVLKPLVEKSRGNLDFGRGFYMTSYLEQANNWALRKARMTHASAFINEYEVPDALDNVRLLRFEEPSAEWVEFVCDCRRGGNRYRNYDLIIGGVADDRVYFAVDMYYQGIWPMEQTLKALRFYGVNDQWCFVNQDVLDRLVSYTRSWQVT